MTNRPITFLMIAGLLTGLLAYPADATTSKKVTILAAKKVAGKVPKVVMVPRKIDGVMVPKGQENLWPVAVMIDNHTQARPQSGLQKASVVYESLAEGGIPRFMAIFATTNIGQVGPVRSTRPYFVRYAAEYNAAMAHAGGSPDGLSLLKSLKMLSLEGIKGKYAKYFYRALGGGVHGLYTNGVKLLAALQQAKYTKLKPNIRSWVFKSDAPLAKRPQGNHGAAIDLGYGYNYTIKYTYNRQANVYLRSTGGRPQIDRQTGKQITVKNVIILIVPKEKVLDKKGRLDLHTLGHDKGVLLRDGKSMPIFWTKTSNRARTIFYDSHHQEIPLNRGNTWITIVPRGHTYRLF